jgi:hypothetical protein
MLPASKQASSFIAFRVTTSWVHDLGIRQSQRKYFGFTVHLESLAPYVI